MLPDGTINPGDMTSFNHYALGAVADWIYQVVGGIRPAAPGFTSIHIEPVPGPGIDWARSHRITPVGRVEVSWRVAGDRFELDLQAPDGVPTEIVFPDGRRVQVTGGEHHLSSALRPADSARS